MRHYVRKTSKGMTPDTDIRIALQEIIVNRKSLNSVSERFNIPKTTLHRYLKKVGGGDIENIHTGYSKHLQIFSYEQEKSIENYIKFAADIYYGLTPHDIKTLAYECAVSYDIKIPDSWHRNKMAGQDWFSGFMQRHKLLSARLPEATSLSRSTSFNKTNVAAFYEKLAEVIDRYKIKGHQIYNVDETGITTVQKPRSIIATKGTKQVGAMTSGERGTLVTTCLAISATGYMVPPILIFPRKNFKAHFIRDGPTGCIGAANSSGWMIGEHFLEFLMHFREHTRPSPLNPVILLLDNHNSHVHVPALNYAKQNGIIMLSFPPHCSHILQPLDRSVFGPLKKYVQTEQDKWMKNNPGKPMTIYDLPGILRTALPKAATPLNISRGFEVAGIFPYNPDVFKDVEFAPSYVTDRPETKQDQNQEVTNNSSVSLSQDSRNQTENDSPEVHDTNQGADQTNTADYRPNEWDILKEHIIKQNLELKDVPGDGHCMLYAVQACMNQEHGENISTEEIIAKLSDEVKTYSQFYNKFAVDGQDIESELNRYITLKEYSSNTGDLVLVALNSALELETTVVQVDGNRVIDIKVGPGRSSVLPAKHIQLAYHGEHYKAVFSKRSTRGATENSAHAENDSPKEHNTPSDQDAQRNKEITDLVHDAENHKSPVEGQNNVDGTEKDIAETKKLFSPESVRPFPKAGERKQTNSKRKRKSAILTDTPEIARFTLEQLKSQIKKSRKVTKGGKKKSDGLVTSKDKPRKKASRRKVLDSDSETDECYCLVCLEPYSNSRSRERWIQCIVCKQWAHVDCVKSGPMFVCINCDSDDSDYVH